MASIFGFETGIGLPKFSLHGWTYWVTVIGIIILFLISGVLVIWMWYMNRIFNKRIEIYENIAGTGWQLTGRDKARIVKVGDGGEEILYLRKRKVYRTAYGKKMGPRTYWFAVGQDGYWYNVVLGDLDAKMGMLDIEPIDRDMRYMHVAIRKNIQERYRKIKFMEKYGTMVISGIFLLIMIIALWFLIGKIGDLVGKANAMIEAAGPLAETMKSIASNLNNICSGGSGIRPA